MSSEEGNDALGSRRELSYWTTLQGRCLGGVGFLSPLGSATSGKLPFYTSRLTKPKTDIEIGSFYKLKLTAV